MSQVDFEAILRHSLTMDALDMYRKQKERAERAEAELAAMKERAEAEARNAEYERKIAWDRADDVRRIQTQARRFIEERDISIKRAEKAEIERDVLAKAYTEGEQCPHLTFKLPTLSWCMDAIKGGINCERNAKECWLKWAEDEAAKNMEEK